MQAYAAFGCGDVATLPRLIAGNVDWHFPECADIPWTGGFRGHEGVKRFLASLAPAASLEAFEPRVFGAQRDRVIVLYPGAKHGLSSPAQRKHVFHLIADYFERQVARRGTCKNAAGGSEAGAITAGEYRDCR